MWRERSTLPCFRGQGVRETRYCPRPRLARRNSQPLCWSAWAPPGAHIARGDQRLRTVVAALKAWSGVVALSWATAGFAASAGTASLTLPQVAAPRPTSTKLPAIELLHDQPPLAGSCRGSGVHLNTLL